MSQELDQKTLSEIEKKSAKDDEITAAAENWGDDEDLSVPDWPKYTDPHTQKKEILAELD